MKSILLISLALCSFSLSTVHLPNEIRLTWEFIDDETIRFTYNVPNTVLQDFDWGGVGFKESDDIGGMTNADIVNFIFEDPLTDRYALENGRPSLDTSIGGTSDLLNPTVFLLSSGFKSQWDRKLINDDQYDRQFVKGSPYRLLWALGKMNFETKEQLQHADNTKGTIDIELTDDFYSDELVGVVLELDKLTNQV